MELASTFGETWEIYGRCLLSERTKYNGGTWSAGKFNSFITSILRSGSRRWAPKYLALDRAKTEKKVNETTGRIAQHFLCSSCSMDFPAKGVQVDHIKPMGKGRTWDEFINELFCEEDNLQVLCVPCHAKKSREENKKK